MSKKALANSWEWAAEWAEERYEVLCGLRQSRERERGDILLSSHNIVGSDPGLS